MKTKINAIIILLMLIISFRGNAQEYLEKTLTGQVNPDQMVTLSAALPFNQAVDLLNKVSEKATGKKIVSLADYTAPIGIEITNMYYEKALDIIVKYAGLVYEKKSDLIIIKKADQPEEQKKDASTYASIDSREVKISAIFFESDVNKARQMGINWQFLLSKNGLDLGGQLGSTSQTNNTGTGGSGTSTNNQTTTSGGNLNASSSFNLGGFFGKATALFNFLESENVGEVITAPSTTVRDGQEGKIQVGSDFSIKQKDFSGNTVEKFYPTGTILTVSPHVYKEDGINYIVLNINAERSTFSVSDLTSEIKKSSATTQVVMLDGEETVIGGLFINEETKVRTGVPLLKDLPWWFFGLRYIFGSDDIKINKKELVILIKAELIPTIKERLAGKQSTNPIRDEIMKNRNQIKYYKFNSLELNKNDSN